LMLGVEWCAPALFTNPVSPKDSANEVKDCRTAASSDTSIAIGTTCSASNGTVPRRLAQPTVYPIAANSHAMAAPMPLLPPVKNTAGR
jgi:hypothetical protein